VDGKNKALADFGKGFLIGKLMQRAIGLKPTL